MQVFIDGIIFQKNEQGGIVRVFREILPRMCELDPDLRITLFIDGPLRQKVPEHPQIKLQRTIPIKRSIRVRGIWKPLIFQFRRIFSRIWHLSRRIWHGSGQGVIWHSTYYTSPSNWRGPKVVTVHDMVHERFPELFNDPLDVIARQNKRDCIENADAIICVSKTTKDDLINYYKIPMDNIQVIYNAYSENFQILNPNDKFVPDISDQIYFLYIGNRSHHKNFSGLIDAYRQWDGRSKVKILVVGPPWTREERRELAQFGISTRLILLSGVDDQMLCQLYNNALAFVYPSLYEGFGIPLLEAMACGCLVIASRIPSTIEIAGEVPLYFDLNQTQTLISALNQVYEGGDFRERKQKGLELIKRYSWQKTAQRTLEMYQSLIVPK
jgi:glycosyltransferase involved in cell wall biosynthesis